MPPQKQKYCGQIPNHNNANTKAKSIVDKPKAKTEGYIKTDLK
jgi:hypothetical protein